jgi:hypothetical protein
VTINPIRKTLHKHNNQEHNNNNKGCVTLVPLPFTLKSIVRRQKKKELWKLKYLTMQKYNLQKKSSKRNQKPSKILQLYDEISSLGFTFAAKISRFWPPQNFDSRVKTLLILEKKINIKGHARVQES